MFEIEIRARIDKIKTNIDNAIKGSGRNVEDITIVAVTKNFDIQRINKAVYAGLTNLGENRVQEFLGKYDKLEKKADWHFIGTLQRNKVRHIIDKVSLIQSLDSLRLAKEIDNRASRIRRIMPVLLQVNPAMEETKSGLDIQSVLPFIEELNQFKHIRVMGLMSMAPYAEDPESVRPYFREVKRLFDSLSNGNYPNVEMKHLSMGMTNDYLAAIKEGSNMIRIGTGIFGSR